MRYPGLALSILSIALLQGCGEKDLSPEQKAYVSKLESELVTTKKDIDSANKASSSYSGGLLKALIETRVEILKTNQALLEQRILSVQSRGSTKIETAVTQQDDVLASKLAEEIAQIKSEIKAARDDAAQYSGGLIQVMKLSTVATKEQSLAMLEQRHLVAKYGLKLVSLSPSAATISPPIEVSSPPTPTVEQLLPPGSGPLGLEAGLSVDLIEKMSGEKLQLSDEAENLYMLKSPPKSNSSFDAYYVVVSPTVGLCAIRAIGKQIDTNSHGTQLRSSYDEMKSALTGIYGKPQNLEYLTQGSIWREPNDWMMGLYKQERAHWSKWEGKQSSPLKSNLSMVAVGAIALASDSGYVRVEYAFNNFTACTEEIKKKSQGSL